MPQEFYSFNALSEEWYSLGDSNPCFRRERATSWTTRRRERSTSCQWQAADPLHIAARTGPWQDGKRDPTRLFRLEIEPADHLKRLRVDDQNDGSDEILVSQDDASTGDC